MKDIKSEVQAKIAKTITSAPLREVRRMREILNELSDKH